MFGIHYHASICKHHVYTVNSPNYTYQSHQLDYNIGYCTDCTIRWATQGQAPQPSSCVSKYEMDSCTQNLQKMTMNEGGQDNAKMYVGPTYLQKAHTLDNADLVYDSIEWQDAGLRQAALAANEGRRAPMWSIETSSMAPGSGFQDNNTVPNAAYASNAAYESAMRSTLFDGPCATTSPASSTKTNSSGHHEMDEEQLAAQYAAIYLCDQGDELADLREMGQMLIAKHGAAEIVERMDGMKLE